MTVLHHTRKSLLSKGRFFVPSAHCPPEVMNIVARDPMGNCYTYMRTRGFECILLAAREECPEQVFVVEELPWDEAFKVLLEKGGLQVARAREFMEFGRVVRLHLYGGATLLYLDAFDRDEAQLLLESEYAVGSLERVLDEYAPTRSGDNTK
jgi:hypothetical protein